MVYNLLIMIIEIIVSAKVKASVKSSFEIDGWKSDVKHDKLIMLFIVNVFEPIDNFLCVLPFRCSELWRFILFLFKMVLLILPSSFFAGFKSLTVGLFWKLGSWFFDRFLLTLNKNSLYYFLILQYVFSLVVYLILCFLANLFVWCRDSIVY